MSHRVIVNEFKIEVEILFLNFKKMFDPINSRHNKKKTLRTKNTIKTIRLSEIRTSADDIKVFRAHRSLRQRDVRYSFQIAAKYVTRNISKGRI